MWTAKFTPSPRIHFHTGRHGVGLVVVVVGRLGGRRGRRSDGVEPLEGRARVPEPELDAGGLERRQRRARALRAPRVREQRAGAVVRDGVLRRLELRLVFHRERREARGERAAVEQFDEREAAAAPVRTTVAAMAPWRWVAAMAYSWGKGRAVGSDHAHRLGRWIGQERRRGNNKTPGQYQPTRPSLWA